MNKNETKTIGHYDYQVPFHSELCELDLAPYRTNSTLHRKIDYIFRHAKHIYREEFIDISTSGSRQLVRDMSIRAVSMVRYFMLYPQQFNHKLDNIHLQILVRMWRQLFKHHSMQSKPKYDKYMSTKMKLLMIENGLMEELIRTVEDKDYIQHNDDMVKVRKGVGLRDRIGMKESVLYALEHIDDGEPSYDNDQSLRY